MSPGAERDAQDVSAQLDAELARRTKAGESMAASLVELDEHPGHRLLRTVTPTGQTAQRWRSAQDSLAGLWQDYETYRGVLAQAREVRERRSRPGEREVTELRRLLREPSIEVARTVVPLDKRGLTGAGERVATITLTELADRMDAAFAQVSELVVDCDEVHSGYLSGLAPLVERLRAARELAGGLDTDTPADPDARALARLAARADELDRTSATDPLSLADPPPAQVLAELAAEIDTVAARLTDLAALRDGWPGRLAAVQAKLDEIVALRQEEDQARRRASEAIANAGLTAPRDPLPRLRARLEGLSSTTAGPDGWRARGRELAALSGAAGSALAATREALELASGLLARRAELRGRLDGYKAKAARLGHAEHRELIELGDQAHRLLWTAPCDLGAATRVLADYQRVVLRLEAEAPVRDSAGGPL